ncbi:MAG: HAD hydrolase family protein [Elusimicrobia bacterium]|nr:HAD hydrolase family protein [Elusimicrobiota bacterium]
MIGWTVFSDLHGTLLDRETQDSGPALPALKALRRSGTPLVLVSSKSLPDMLAVRRRLGHRGAFIFENGGGVALRAGSPAGRPAGFKAEGRLWIRMFGPSRENLLGAIESLRRRTGARIAEVGRMPLKELAARTGFSLERAERCRQRRCSAPFFLDSPRDLPAVRRTAGEMGFKVAHGGRFYHLLGSADKGTAAKAVLGLLGGARSAALGDAQTDIPLLRAVDRPYLVQQAPGVWEPIRVKGLRRVPAPGPQGFRLAVEDLLEGSDSYR